MKYTLYGDGIHTDTEAIQELLDNAHGQVILPAPENFYLIDKPLRISSNTELILPAYAIIRLKEMCNCHMLECDGAQNVTVRGGIWDYNNLQQLKNPFHFSHDAFPAYDGQMFMLTNMKNLVLSGITFKDPVTYAVTMDTVSYFTIENIVFDFNRGNPRPMNMDGIHLNGNCHYGTMRNLQGACYDDLVALNADEGSDGPITHISIDGIYCEGCHSAARLLSVKNEVSHIHISNVYGSFYQYCIGITKYYPGKTVGYFDSIVLDNIHAEKSPRYGWLHWSEDFALHSYVYPIIFMEAEVHVKSLSISELYRVEKCVPVSTVFLGKDGLLENLTVRNAVTENQSGKDMVFFDLQGEVQHQEIVNARAIGCELNI